MNEKSYKDLGIYSTNYIKNKTIKILSLHYQDQKKYLMADDYMLGRILNKIKKITDIEKFDDTKILIDTDDKL